MYFEARSEQQQADLAALRDESEHLKRELATAAQREIGLRRQVAELEVQLSRAHAERQELGRLNDVLRSERAQTLGKLLESAQLRTSDGEDDSGLDLARFIAELRSEVLTLRSQTAANVNVAARAIESSVVQASAAVPEVSAQPALALAVAGPRPMPMPSASSAPVAAYAERFSVEGRLRVSVQEAESLTRHGAPLEGRAEETLFGFSVRELASPDAQARLRAAERLKAIGHSAAAPALATALHSETSPEVQVALVNAFAELAGHEGVAIVSPLLHSAVADVRIAALKGLLKLEPKDAAPHLSAAIRDPDPAVRRRASLLALGLNGEAALGLGEEGVRDSDPEVRALAALVLGASFGERARAALLTALQDGERKVRQAAAQSLSRLLGEDVSALVDVGEAQRRREIRRLATLPAAAVDRRKVNVTPPRERRGGASAVRSGSARTDARPPGSAGTVSSVRGDELRAGSARVDSANALRQGSARAHSDVALRPGSTRAGGDALTAGIPHPAVSQRERGTYDGSDELLCTSILSELRSALRGKTLPDLCASMSANEAAVQQACELLVARGQAVRRGMKYFQA